MNRIKTISELRKVISEYKRLGKTIAFVPTMGNLHQGHLQLVSMAQKQADIVVCSIFVNPLQFGEGEDFEQYPRTLDEDCHKLQKMACDIVFAPAMTELYPESRQQGQDQTQVMLPEISNILEGASRPGHFTGVATIVAKLFNIVQADKAIFGAKDYQQLQVIKQFVKDLCFPIEILSHPIVREANGLAMSSRNAYLSKEQRAQAALIQQSLQKIAQQLRAGARNYQQLENDAQQLLDTQGFVSDYISIRCPDLSLPEEHCRDWVVLAAIKLGSTRLLDNIEVSL